jgi:hypothetical protein
MPQVVTLVMLSPISPFLEKLNIELKMLPMLNLSEITSKLLTSAKFVAANRGTIQWSLS